MPDPTSPPQGRATPVEPTTPPPEGATTLEGPEEVDGPTKIEAAPSTTAPEKIEAAPSTKTPQEEATPEEVASSPEPSGASVSLGVQFIEIVQVSPDPRHVTALVVPGLTVAGLVSPRWVLYGVVGLSTGIDTASIGGSAVLGADAALAQGGGWRFGLGPELAFIQSATRLDSRWSWASIFTGGVAMSLGKGRTVLSTGLAASVSPQFQGTVSLVPRLGVSVAF